MILKKVLILFILLNSIIGISQTEFPFYEQIAFDFYQSTIIDSFPTKKKVKVYPNVFELRSDYLVFNNPSCLGLSWKSNDQYSPLKEYVQAQMNYKSKIIELDVSNLDKKKFKVKKRVNRNYPRLQITAPHIEIDETNRIFVNIYERHEHVRITYHLEFNIKGKIINWCRDYSEIIKINKY